MMTLQKQFIEFAIKYDALRFGNFITKAGRESPYFFNAGLFHDGAALKQLAVFYAEAINTSKLTFDVIFGPAYKGIVLASATAMALSDTTAVPFCFNRKEAKDHGEGGMLIGAPLQGRVLMIDDVISAGTSVRESVTLIEAAGASLAGVVIALDRMERGQQTLSAVEEVEQRYHVPVISIATLDDLVNYLQQQPMLHTHLEKLLLYRKQYGTVD